MNEILAFFAILLSTLAGLGILKRFKLLNLSDFEQIPYAFGLGIGLISFLLYFYSRLGIPWNLLTVILPVILIIIFTKPIPKFSIYSLNIGRVGAILLTLIVGLNLFVIFESLLRPIFAWDGWATWLLKSKIFYIDQAITPEAFSYVQSDYPLLIGLYGTYIYTVFQNIDDRSVLLIFSMFYLMLSLIFFTSIRKIIGTRMGLVFTFLLISSQNLIRHGGRFEAGHVDLILGFYIFTSIMLLLLYIKSKNIKTLFLLGIFLGLTSIVKNEGIVISLFIFILLIIWIIKNKLWRHLYGLIPFLAIILDWQLFKQMMQVQSNYLFENIAVYPERVLIIFSGIFKEFINVQNWNLLWVVFILSIPYYLYIKKDFANSLVLLVVLFQLSAYIFIFFITPVDPRSHIMITDRLLLHIAPLATFFIGLSIFGRYENNKLK